MPLKRKKPTKQQQKKIYISFYFDVYDCLGCRSLVLIAELTGNEKLMCWEMSGRGAVIFIIQVLVWSRVSPEVHLTFITFILLQIRL